MLIGFSLKYLSILRHFVLYFLPIHYSLMSKTVNKIIENTGAMFQLLLELARLTPFILPLIFFLNFLITLRYINLYVVALIIFNMLFNWTLKQLVKAVYKATGRQSLPLLGRGYRPVGARDCSLTHKCNDKIATSFGMPSGHSQITWAVAVYWLIVLYYKDRENESEQQFKEKYIPTAIAIILLSLVVSFSRVRKGCHTIQQVIIGGIIGAGTGVLAFQLQPDFSKKEISRQF